MHSCVRKLAKRTMKGQCVGLERVAAKGRIDRVEPVTASDKRKNDTHGTKPQ